jgi:hypothetical protein
MRRIFLTVFYSFLVFQKCQYSHVTQTSCYAATKTQEIHPSFNMQPLLALKNFTPTFILPGQEFKFKCTC